MDLTNTQILIIDDNPMNIELLEATLEPLNCKILAYTNPLKALDELEDTKVELALVDIVMPEMDGFTFTENFLKSHPNTPIIFVSAHGDDDKKVRGFNQGSYAYVEKPFNVNTTRAQVKSVLKLKQTQDELLKEKNKLDIIYEFAQDEIVLTNTNFDIISHNHKLLTKPCHTINFKELLKNNNQTEEYDNLEKFINSDEKYLSFRVVIDNEIYTKTNITKIVTDNEVTGYLIVMVNLTQEIVAAREKERFIETLTHDLKTPVRAEKRALELLYHGSFGELTEDQKSIVLETLNSARYMTRMTDNVLAKYKIQNGHCKINKKTNSIKQTLFSSIENLKYLIEAAEQTIKVNTEIENDLLDFDEIEIKRVITNLVANASECSPKGTTIEVFAKEKENYLEVSVKDEGPGIENDKKDEIFCEYISGAKRFKKVGSGLGLFISKKIIEAHNGNIRVESNAGSGAKFIFELPYNTCAQEILSGCE